MRRRPPAWKKGIHRRPRTSGGSPKWINWTRPDPRRGGAADPSACAYLRTRSWSSGMLQIGLEREVPRRQDRVSRPRTGHGNLRFQEDALKLEEDLVSRRRDRIVDPFLDVGVDLGKAFGVRPRGPGRSAACRGDTRPTGRRTESPERWASFAASRVQPGEAGIGSGEAREGSRHRPRPGTSPAEPP